jgi:hypothetical protein
VPSLPDSFFNSSANDQSGGGSGTRGNSETRSGPRLKRCTSSSVTTRIPTRASPTIATLPPTMRGHTTSITLIPVSTSLLAPTVRGGPASSGTILASSSRLAGVSLWRPEFSTVLPRGKSETGETAPRVNGWVKPVVDGSRRSESLPASDYLFLQACEKLFVQREQHNGSAVLSVLPCFAIVRVQRVGCEE